MTDIEASVIDALRKARHAIEQRNEETASLIGALIAAGVPDDIFNLALNQLDEVACRDGWHDATESADHLSHEDVLDLVDRTIQDVMRGRHAKDS